jgi:hypothetical protein
MSTTSPPAPSSLPTNDPATSPLLLIPTPRSVERGAGTFPATDKISVTKLARAKNPEHYKLSISKSGISIKAASPAAERAARATLAQITRQFGQGGGQLPEVEIQDWPAFTTRGVMLDVSRCRIPRMDEFTRIIETLAGLKINHLQLYTEHTFAYDGAEDVWTGWSPITPDEIHRLDALCRSHGIELAANQNCFGHLHQWMKSPRFKDLAETHGDWMFDLWPRSGAFSICPVDPESEKFVESLLRLLTPCFESPYVNIGCDETFDIGWGRSKAAVAEHGRARVYLDFVAKISKIVKKLGKKPMFWADIALSHPEHMKDIPKNLVALAWGYEPDAPFEKWCTELKAAGRETWLCPGTSSWRSITGRTSERHGNLAACATAGVKHGIEGFLMTDWGDTGHWQQWPIALHALAHGAHAAWTGDATTFDARASAVHALGAPVQAAGLGPWLERLGDADLALRQVSLPLSRAPKPGEPPVLRNQSALMSDLFKTVDEQRDIGSEWQWYNTHETIHKLTEEFERELINHLPPLIADEIVHTLDLAGFAAARGWCRRMNPENRPVTRTELLEWLEDLVREHRRLWQARSRSGGLQQSCAFFDQVRQKTLYTKPTH